MEFTERQTEILNDMLYSEIESLKNCDNENKEEYNKELDELYTQIADYQKRLKERIKNKPKHRTYFDIVPESRLQELELIAFASMTGESVIDELEEIDMKIANEYEELAYEDE